jgi:hypothetical protein
MCFVWISKPAAIFCTALNFFICNAYVPCLLWGKDVGELWNDIKQPTEEQWLGFACFNDCLSYRCYGGSGSGLTGQGFPPFSSILKCRDGARTSGGTPCASRSPLEIQLKIPDKAELLQRCQNFVIIFPFKQKNSSQITNLFPPMHTQNSLLPVTSQRTNLPLPNFPTSRREQSLGIFRAVKYLVHPLIVIVVSFITLFIIIAFFLVHIRCQRYR